ncbi:hypothetical protein NKH19_07785 [Mesorhizobium sp. M1338]|uniref:hypothetical protein n=1 Tax=unclassified Mesorhizobium TaxID=325217 RepID=UPI00333DE7C4
MDIFYPQWENGETPAFETTMCMRLCDTAGTTDAQIISGVVLPLIRLPAPSPRIVTGRREAAGTLGALLATLMIGEIGDDGVFLPVTIRGVEERSAKRTKSQLLGFSSDERPAGQ